MKFSFNRCVMTRFTEWDCFFVPHRRDSTKLGSLRVFTKESVSCGNDIVLMVGATTKQSNKRLLYFTCPNTIGRQRWSKKAVCSLGEPVPNSFREAIRRGGLRRTFYTVLVAFALVATTCPELASGAERVNFPGYQTPNNFFNFFLLPK